MKYIPLHKAMSCGGCDKLISVESKYTCSVCGRMLCKSCAAIYGVCKDHLVDKPYLSCCDNSENF
jgi:hypothetical protein